MQKRNRSRSKSSACNRWAAATIEFALCAPVFFFLIFGGIEISRVNMLIHSVESSLLQGARRGIVPGATAEQCRQAAQDVLDIARIRNSTITVSPTTILDTTTSVTISVSVPTDGNGYQASSLFLGKTISRTATLNREH